MNVSYCLKDIRIKCNFHMLPLENGVKEFEICWYSNDRIKWQQSNMIMVIK